MAGYSNAEDLQRILGAPVTITSGDRSPQKNRLVGGVANSAHLKPGMARDFVPKGMSTKEAAQKLAKSGIAFDQIIDENDHVHISQDPRNRQQVLGPKVANVSDSDLLNMMGGAPKEAAQPKAANVSDDQLLAAMGGEAPSPASPGKPQAPTAAGGKPTYQGMPFGFQQNFEASLPFGKDIMAGVPAGLDALTGRRSFGEGYRNNLADINAAQAAYGAENPGLATTGSGLGIVASGGPVRGAISGGVQTLGQLMKSGAKGGAALGALFGLGEAGDGTGDLGDRLVGSAKGAGVGAGVGAALPVAGAVVKPVGKALGATAAAITEKLGITNPDQKAKAQNLLLRALERDQTSATEIATALSSSGGKPLTAMDVAGTNVKRQARNLVTQPGEAGDKVTKFLGERAENQSGRVLGDIKSHLSSNTDVYGLADNLVKERSVASMPLYKAAFDKPAVTTDRLKDFAADADIQAGMREGIKLAKREALAKGEKFKPSDYAITEFNAAGDPIIGPVPKWRTWQAAKEGLDQKIESYRNEITRQLPDTKEVRSLVNLKNALLKELDAVNPEYKVARAAWGGPSQSKTAMRMGEDFLKADKEEIQKAYAGMSEADKDFYRIGAARALQDKANSASDSADLSKRLFGNARIREQIETVFGKGAADKFGKAMGAEGEMAHTGRFVLGGSNTANKAADMADSHMELAQDIMSGFIHGGPKGAATLGTYGALKRGLNNLFTGMNHETANHLAEALTAQGQGATTLYRELAAEQAARSTRAAGRQNIGKGINRLVSGAAAASAVRSNQQ